MSLRDRITDVKRMTGNELARHPRNPRKHPDDQRAALAGVLNEIGKAGVLYAWYSERNGGALTIWDGHLRLEDYPDETWHVAITDLSDAEADYMLAVQDRVPGMADYDAETLDALLRDVQTADEAVAAMLSELAADAGVIPGENGDGELEDVAPQIDRAEELRKEWGTETGQLWEIPGTAGVHRVLCGDSNEEQSVQADSSVFDPPWDEMPNMKMPQPMLAFCDAATIGMCVERFGPPVWLFTWDCVTSWYTPNRPLRRQKCCLWYGQLAEYNKDGWHYGESGQPRQVSNSRGSYWFQPDSRGKHLSDVYQSPITRLHSSGPHPHEKPLEWVLLLMGNCLPGGIVADPFLGSGTTLIAAEQLGRICYGIEISPAYVAVILQRCKDAGMEPRLTDN